MTEIEMTVLLGELVSIEIDDVNSINYENETCFVVIMESGKRFRIEVKATQKSQML